MSKTTWTVEKLTDYYSGLGNVDGAHMQRVLDWAVENDRYVESEAKAALFSIAGKKGDRLFAVFSSGHIYVWFDDFRYPGGLTERDQLAATLKEMDLMKADFDVNAVKEGKTLSRKVGVLSEAEMGDLLDLLASYCL
jgi:hypothetical protein